jgi:hypothetical protein
MGQSEISKYNINALRIPIKNMHHYSQHDAYIMHYINGYKLGGL